MNIKETFLKLTSHTYPNGKESEVIPLLPSYLKKDGYGNLYYEVGNSDEYDVMFTSHLDTATSVYTPIEHVFNGKMISTKNTILGADDKAGVVIMLYMIEKKVKGLYYFFLGEEVGMLGSKWLASEHNKKKLDNIKKVVSFDRRGYDSVITFQKNGRCCSDKFANALASELNKADSTFKFKSDNTGFGTDSVQFQKLYKECTNISVGYFDEHRTTERQDIEFLEKIAIACTKVDWKSLPAERDETKTEHKYSNNYNYNNYNNYNNNIKNFYDSKFKKNSSVTIINGRYTSVNLHNDRLVNEKSQIIKIFDEINFNYDTIEWDGVKLVIKRDKYISIMNRADVIDVVPELHYENIKLESKV